MGLCRRTTAVFFRALSILTIFLASTQSQAMDRDLRALITFGQYGLLGGTVVGLATVPFTHGIRSMFLGSSIGLYMGIAAGVYHITHRDDPGNPFNTRRTDDLPRDQWYRVRIEEKTPAPVLIQISAKVLEF